MKTNKLIGILLFLVSFVSWYAGTRGDFQNSNDRFWDIKRKIK